MVGARVAVRRCSYTAARLLKESDRREGANTFDSAIRLRIEYLVAWSEDRQA